MTTGGPDTSDVYEEEVQDGKYKFRGVWRPLETRHEKIGVKVGDKIDWKEVDHRIHRCTGPSWRTRTASHTRWRSPMPTRFA